MAEVTKDEVLAALSKIQDPDLHRDIVTLGFVPEDGINICDGNVSVKIVLTTPACPVRDQMQAGRAKIAIGVAGSDARGGRWTRPFGRPASVRDASQLRACETSSR
jgi:metal-sulfur cluster biosynthetic enzyme